MILSFLPGSVQSLLRDVHYQYIQIIKFNKDVIMVILFSKSHTPPPKNIPESLPFVYPIKKTNPIILGNIFAYTVITESCVCSEIYIHFILPADRRLQLYRHVTECTTNKRRTWPHLIKLVNIKEQIQTAVLTFRLNPKVV